MVERRWTSAGDCFYVGEPPRGSLSSTLSDMPKRKHVPFGLVHQIVQFHDMFRLIASFLKPIALKRVARCSKDVRMASLKHYVPKLRWRLRALGTHPPELARHIRHAVVTGARAGDRTWSTELAGYCNLRSIKFSEDFDQTIAKGMLPAGIKRLKLNQKERYSESLVKGVLPAGLHRLVLGPRFAATPLPGALPRGLTHLAFGAGFNRPLQAGVLPKSLKHLKLDTSYNHPLEVGVLPAKLTTLKFKNTSAFNHPLKEGVLPSSLRCLTFGWQFDCPIPVNVLPASLKYLKFGDNFNRPMAKGALPSGLETLLFGWLWFQELSDGVLPKSLTMLRVGQQVIQFSHHAGLKVRYML